MTSAKKNLQNKKPAAQLSMKLYLRMVKYAGVYWKVFLFSIFSLIILSATNTGFLATIKMVTDEGFVKHDETKFQILPLILFSLIALRALSGFFAVFSMRWVARHVVEDLRLDAFSKLMSLPVSFFDANSAGGVTSKFT